MLYNLVFTVLPVLALGIFDQDVSANTALKVPEIYPDTHNHHASLLFLGYVADGIYQSVVTLFLPLFTYGETASNFHGFNASLYEMTIAVAIAAVFTVDIYVAFTMFSINLLSFLAILACAVSLFVYIPIYAAIITSSQLHNITPIVYAQPTMYLCVIITITLCLIPKVVARYIHENYFFDNSQIVREMQAYKRYIEQLSPKPQEKAESFLLKSPPSLSPIHISPSIDTPLSTELERATTISRASGKRKSIWYDAKDDTIAIGNTGYAFAQSPGTSKAVQVTETIERNQRQFSLRALSSQSPIRGRRTVDGSPVSAPPALRSTEDNSGFVFDSDIK